MERGSPGVRLSLPQSPEVSPARTLTPASRRTGDRAAVQLQLQSPNFESLDQSQPVRPPAPRQTSPGRGASQGPQHERQPQTNRPSSRSATPTPRGQRNQAGTRQRSGE